MAVAGFFLVFILYYLCFAIPNVKISIDTFLIQLFLVFPDVLCKAVPQSPGTHPKVSQEALTSAARGRCGRGWDTKKKKSIESYFFHVAGQK